MNAINVFAVVATAGIASVDFFRWQNGENPEAVRLKARRWFFVNAFLFVTNVIAAIMTASPR